MATKWIMVIASLLLGAAAGFLNDRITKKLINEEVSVNRVMAANFAHILVAAAVLGIILGICKALKTDCTIPLFSGATGLVITQILLALSGKKEQK